MKRFYKVRFISRLTVWAVIISAIATGAVSAKQYQARMAFEKQCYQANSIAASATLAVVNPSLELKDIPAYRGEPYVEINGNVPFFDVVDLPNNAFEYYGDLDEFGRCTSCMACIGEEIMPTEERGDISRVKPTGWKQKKYAGLVEEDYLYNRCHLIAFCLTAENDNVDNLITGTKYMNTEGMFPFECQGYNYISGTGNHVLYRVTPIFAGKNKLASGVLIEAKSVEDQGKGLEFCVFCYNVQPGIEISYVDGSNWRKR